MTIEHIYTTVTALLLIGGSAMVYSGALTGWELWKWSFCWERKEMRRYVIWCAVMSTLIFALAFTMIYMRGDLL